MARHAQASQVPGDGAFQEPRLLEGGLIERQEGIECVSP